MRRYCLFLVSVFVFCLAGAADADFVQDPDDGLAADTVDLVISVAPDAAGGQMNVQMDIYLFCDDRAVFGTGMGYAWDNPNLQMDSAVLSPVAESAFDLLTVVYDQAVLAVSNSNQRFPVGLFSMTSPYLAPHNERRILASYYFTLSDWSAGDSIVVDTLAFNLGTEFSLAKAIEGGSVMQIPYWTGRKVIYDTPAFCCVQRVGDANGVDGDEPTIGDISVMIDAKFISGTCDGIIACLSEADINLSGGANPTCDDITIGDISILQDYLFITGPSLGLNDCY